MHAVPLVLFDRDSDGRRIESDRSALRYAPQGAAPTFGSSSSASLDDISQRLETLVDTWVSVREGLVDLILSRAEGRST